LADALGSTLALADGSGTIQTQYAYEPFGKTTVAGAASGNVNAYTGRELDETGLYFYRARYYEPQIGRFLSEDPIQLRGGPNLYVYVRNSPVLFIGRLFTWLSQRCTICARIFPCR
jgi:RHS repeat-associated protein